MRVLLIRLDGIGDAAVCTPLLAALHDAGHEVGVALTTRNAGTFAPHAVMAEHVLERIPWPAHGSSAESTARAAAEIAAMRYDVALVASEEPEAFELAAPLRERVGFSTGWERPLKTLWVRRRTTRTVSRSQRIGAEDAHEVEIVYRLGVGLVHALDPPSDPVRLRGELVEPAPRAASGTIVLQGGPKWRASGVADEALRAMIERLAPHEVSVIAAPADAAAVRDTTGREPRTFAGVRPWVEALDRASLLITVDTGAAHVAGMLGVPVVDVFPERDFDAQVRRWRPWASRYGAIRASETGGVDRAFIETILDGI